jgi:hydroxypyruvate isomerase
VTGREAREASPACRVGNRNSGTGLAWRSNTRGSSTVPSSTVWPERSPHRTLVDNLRFAAAALEKEGIRLLVEPLNPLDFPGFCLYGSRGALNLIGEVNHPNLWLQYDIYHMQIAEGDIMRTIQNNISKIAHIQIADNPGRNEPGTGEINYPNIFRFLDKQGYDGWIGCEYRPLGKTGEGLEWIKSYR